MVSQQTVALVLQPGVGHKLLCQTRPRQSDRCAGCNYDNDLTANFYPTILSLTA